MNRRCPVTRRVGLLARRRTVVEVVRQHEDMILEVACSRSRVVLCLLASTHVRVRDNLGPVGRHRITGLLHTVAAKILPRDCSCRDVVRVEGLLPRVVEMGCFPTSENGRVFVAGKQNGTKRGSWLMRFAR